MSNRAGTAQQRRRAAINSSAFSTTASGKHSPSGLTPSQQVLQQQQQHQQGIAIGGQQPRQQLHQRQQQQQLAAATGLGLDHHQHAHFQLQKQQLQQQQPNHHHHYNHLDHNAGDRTSGTGVTSAVDAALIAAGADFRGDRKSASFISPSHPNGGAGITKINKGANANNNSKTASLSMAVTDNANNNNNNIITKRKNSNTNNAGSNNSTTAGANPSTTNITTTHSSSGSSVPSGTATPVVATAHSSLLQPRVAVALGLSKRWHPMLFFCRLASIAPGVWWGLPSALRLLAMLHLIFFSGGALSSTSASGGDSSGGGGSVCVNGGGGGVSGSGGGGGSAFGSPGARGFSVPISYYEMSFEARLRLTETLLATIWCGASAYLSFFFTDCLMSRWLLNYTPQATLVRLLTISALNGYLTSWILYLTAGSQDPRLLLPAWIVISALLTAAYHLSQRKINIRKETSMSISVFSIASFISMVCLLAQLHSSGTRQPPEYPPIPLVVFVKRVWSEAGKIAFTLLEYGNVTTKDFFVGLGHGAGPDAGPGRGAYP